MIFEKPRSFGATKNLFFRLVGRSMKSLHRSLLFVSLAIPVVPLGTGAGTTQKLRGEAGGSAPAIQVGPNVHVSQARPSNAHYETLLAADPNNPGHLLGASMVFSEKRNKYEVVVYHSSDGGLTWNPTLEVSEGGWRNWDMADPAVAYGPDGTAYFVAFGYPPSGKVHMLVFRSQDRCKTWAPPTRLPSVDRPYIVTDDTGGKYNKRVYVHGAGGVRVIDGDKYFIGVTIFRSAGAGAAFEPPINLASTEGHYVLGMGNSIVLSDGTLVILFGELRSYEWLQPVPEAKPSKPNAWLKVITSEDGGETFSKAVIVNDFYLPWGTLGSTSMPYLAADRSSGPFKDRLYAVWPDVRSGRVEIFFAYSRDKGKTWSKPIVVNDDRAPAKPPKGSDHFMPVVAVNREGVVGVMWYDRAERPGNLDWWVRFAASLDGGEAFSPSVKVSEVAFVHHGKDERWVIEAHEERDQGGPLKLRLGINSFYYRGGDTAGLAADADGVFHPFWVDNRTGVSQIWTARVTVKAKAVRNGSPELAELEDVSEKASLEYTNTHYDRTTNTLSVDAQIVNASEHTLIGPVKLRALSLKSQLGAPEILNSDNGEKGAGAVWDFTSLLQNNRLEPQQKSGIKRLQFRLSDLHPLSRSVRLSGLIQVEAKLLGKAGGKAP